MKNLYRWACLLFIGLLVASCSDEFMDSDEDDEYGSFYYIDGKWKFDEWTYSPYSYSLDFDINLIVAGKYVGLGDRAPVEKLADKILKRSNMALNPGGINVRNINVLYASEHPFVGEAFPDTKEVILHYGEENPLIDSLIRWPGHEGEISFVLGYFVYDDLDEKESVAGFSRLPGEIYYEDSDRSDFIALAMRINHGNYKLTSDKIAQTAIHELGHFFGLPHTTEFSGIRFDDFSDTPECPNLGDHLFDESKCPDYYYIMFPRTGDESYKTFTPQQMDVIRMYLSTKKHK